MSTPNKAAKKAAPKDLTKGGTIKATHPIKEKQCPPIIPPYQIPSAGKVFKEADFLDYSDTWIETGTCAGSGVERALAAGFKEVRSVEAWKDFYDQCVPKFRGRNVQLFLGKSPEQLLYMLPDKRCVIFLDAHPAGPNTTGHNELMAGDTSVSQDAVITAELQVILAHRKDHVIIIDDQNGNNPENAVYSKTLAGYSFSFYDELLAGKVTKDKILVCVPK